MWKLLTWLFCGCWHKWNILYKYTLKDDMGSVGERYVLQCIKCGIVKKKDLI